MPDRYDFAEHRQTCESRIAWKTNDEDLKTSGQVTFTDLPHGQVEITVTSQTVPSEHLIEKMASVLFEDEEAQTEKDPRNFKALAENRQT